MDHHAIRCSQSIKHILHFSITEEFLSYHPNIAATGHVRFFERDQEFKKGIEHYINKMPKAR